MVSRKEIYFGLWILLYSTGVVLPSLVLLPFLGMKRTLLKTGLFFILLYLFFSVKVLLGPWDNAFWFLQSFKLLDGLIFISLLALKESEGNGLLMTLFLLFGTLISVNNQNFGGWLTFLSAMIMFQSTKGFIRTIIILVLFLFSISLEAYTYALAIIPFLLFPSKRSFLVISFYSFLGATILLLLFDYLLRIDVVPTLVLIAPTFVIRPAMWIAFFDNISLCEFLFGSKNSLTSFVNTEGYSSSYIPFQYVGKSFHNIWVDIIWKFGSLLILLSFILLRRLPKRVYYLPLLIIWSFEPSLGVFQLVTIYIIEKRFYADNLYTRS
jgi:hypothetical protein